MAALAWLLQATRRLAASLHVAVKHSQTWESRGLIPDDIFRLLTELDAVEAHTRLTRLARLLGCSTEEAGHLVKLTLNANQQLFDQQDEESATNVLAAYLRALLWERRDQDVERGVSSALADAVNEFDRLIPSQTSPSDQFDWDWPERSSAAPR